MVSSTTDFFDLPPTHPAPPAVSEVDYIGLQPPHQSAITLNNGAENTAYSYFEDPFDFFWSDFQFNIISESQYNSDMDGLQWDFWCRLNITGILIAIYKCWKWSNEVKKNF